MTWGRAAVLISGLTLGPVSILAQTVAVRGIVTDSATRTALSGVHVVWHAETTSIGQSGQTDAAGRFMFGGLAPGRYQVTFTRAGYGDVRLDGIVVPDNGLTLPVAMAARGIPLDPVVVSVARADQTRLDAPASVSVIERRDIETDGHVEPLEQIRTLPGVDFASKGLIQHTFEVRGPRAVSGGAILMLTDYRSAELPSLGLNIPYLVPASREDIDRIELVRGPAAALYGPGAPRGVLHIVTRSPFESSGGVVSVAGGERATAQGTFRYAALVHPQVAVALSGEYVRGNDWQWVDTKEIVTPASARAQCTGLDTSRIGRRDFAIARVGGEARIDWRPSAGTEVVAKSGVAEAINNIELTGVGAVQVRHWRSSYWQGWLRHGRFFANATYSASNAGTTYSLRTGCPFVDQSRVAAAQLQDGRRLGRADLTYGADVRWTDPRTDSTIDGRNERADRLTETGAYAQLAVPLSVRLQFIAALRADYHSRLGDVVLSPRAGIVYKPRPTQAIRLTYNRAFSSPSPSALFADIQIGSLPLPGGFATRMEGIPLGGFTFRRDCSGGLCMRSPYNTGGANAYLPADATLLWPALVNLLKADSIDLSNVPAPTATEVATILAAAPRRGNTFESVAPSDVADIAPLRREITNVLELGYKGEFEGRFFLATDAWLTRVYDGVAPSSNSVTPNVFFDSVSLKQYLATHLPQAQAARAAQAAAALPMGTISPRESPYPYDVLFVNRQGQRYTLWGLDAAIELAVTPWFSVSGTYSWVSNDSLADPAFGAPVVLSVPRNKGSLRLTYRADAGGLLAAVQARSVASFPLGPGNQGYGDTRLSGYNAVDVEAAYRIPPYRTITLAATVQNVLDKRHREVAGAPALGRLAMARVRIEF